MHKFLSIFFLLLSTAFFSQNDSISNKKDSASPVIKAPKWDTTMYRKFDYVLIVGVYQLHRNFSNEFEGLINLDTSKIFNHSNTHKYLAESRLIGGIVLSYDKFQVSFGTRSQPQNNSAGKGYTKAFNLGLSFGDNKWICENYFRRFKGFYDQSSYRDTSVNKNSPQYDLHPNLTSSLFMNRFMYFTNHHEYAFKSGFGCNYRQLKTAATWIVGGSFNTYNLTNDSAIFPVQSRQLFNDYANFKGFQSVNIGFSGGLAGTLVLFKAWFLGGYFTLGPEQQWRKYNLGASSRNISYLSWSGTGRASLGLNLKKFYFLGWFCNDYNLYNSTKILNFKSSATTGGVSIGWRFHIGTPKYYQKFQKTKFYKLFG